MPVFGVYEIDPTVKTGLTEQKYQNLLIRIRVNFKNCVAPYTHHWHYTLNFYSTKSFSKVGRRAWTVLCWAQNSLRNWPLVQFLGLGGQNLCSPLLKLFMIGAFDFWLCFYSLNKHVLLLTHKIALNILINVTEGRLLC